MQRMYLCRSDFAYLRSLRHHRLLNVLLHVVVLDIQRAYRIRPMQLVNLSLIHDADGLFDGFKLYTYIHITFNDADRIAWFRFQHTQFIDF